MRRLFGMISKHSTAARGVASWIGSLAVSRANPTASPARNGALPTSGISGRMPDGLSANVSPAQSSWKTFQASHGITSTPLGLSYEDWDTGLKRDFFQRKRWVLPTYENGSSSWVTPTARSSASQNGEWKGTYYVRENGTKVASVLVQQAINWQPPLSGLWRSPAATDADGGTIQHEGVDPSQMICYLLRDQRKLADLGGRRRERKDGLRQRESEPDQSSPSVAFGNGNAGGLHLRQRKPGQAQPETGRSGANVPGPLCERCQGLLRIEQDSSLQELGYLFPPGPSDLKSWARVLDEMPEAEPAFCSLADGVAWRLDATALRPERLRVLGNGVVPLVAAHAVPTLAARALKSTEV